MTARPTTPTRRMIAAGRLQALALAVIAASALIPLILAAARLIQPQTAGWLAFSGLAVATALALISWPLEVRR